VPTIDSTAVWGVSKGNRISRRVAAIYLLPRYVKPIGRSRVQHRYKRIPAVIVDSLVDIHELERSFLLKCQAVKIPGLDEHQEFRRG